MAWTRNTRLLGASVAVIAALGVTACGDDTETISQEAESIAEDARDRAEGAAEDAEQRATDLREDLEKRLDEAGEGVDEGIARAQAELFKQQLTELGTEDAPSRRVSDLEEIASDLPGEPDVTGIEDEDGDGEDDDGKVEIGVDGSAACVTIGASSVDVADGSC